MIAIALQSGSNGNSIYVESGNVRLLFDAGISGAQAAERLRSAGRDIRDVDAVIISHDHNDHVRSAGVYHRKFGLPIYVTEKTIDAAGRRCRLGRFDDLHHFRPGQLLSFGHATVHSIPTPHDAAEGAAFVVEAEGKRLGILTDLGHVFDGLPELIGLLDAVFIESNYDPKMLERGPYPPALKRRIRGKAGHLSNLEAAALLRDAAPAHMRWACLSHLSEQNNSPELALRTHREVLDGRLDVLTASRHQPTPLPEF